MLRNYLKIAYRNLLKNKVYSFINIGGLAVGMAVAMVIGLWVFDELSIDGFHKNGNRIFKVISREYIDGKVNGYFDTPGLLGEEVKRIIPEVQLACNYSDSELANFSNNKKKLSFKGGFAGEDYFKIFSFPIVLGTKNEALKNIDAISISEKMAIAFFGSPANAINKTVRYSNYQDFTVKAVFADLKPNSSAKFDFLISWEFFKKREPWCLDWNNSGPEAFILLKENAKAEVVNIKIKDFIKGYVKEYKEANHLELGLQPYEETYLNSRFENGDIAGGRVDYLKLFGLVAIGILLIACINFMNLNIALSLKRSKEIGLRKVIGAKQSKLFGQFMSEIFLFTFIAFCISFALVLIVLPLFNSLAEKTILFPFKNPIIWFSFFSLLIIVTLFSGFYPAVYLSNFKPIAVLKSNIKIGNGLINIRKGLVIFQFTIAIVFIISTILISKQIDYIFTKNIGYQKENLILVPRTGTLIKNDEVFVAELKKLPNFINYSSMSHEFTSYDNSTTEVIWPGKRPNTNPKFSPLEVSYNFLKTIDAKMLLGREFSPAFADSTNYIINEAALKIIGYKQPIGKSITSWNGKGEIVGVVKDFHFNSFVFAVDPLIMRLSKKVSYGSCLIRVDGKNMTQILSQIEGIHKKINPDFVFNYKFTENEFSKLYKNENLAKQLATFFTFLAIIISCLGLLGLVIFSTQQRTKEIGIRKVLGATVANLWQLLSKDFVVLVIISCLIAAPIAYYFMHNWLQKYTYRTEISWWIFVAAGVGALLITLLTVSYQAIKAALMNPVKSLKTE